MDAPLSPHREAIISLVLQWDPETLARELQAQQEDFHRVAVVEGRWDTVDASAALFKASHYLRLGALRAVCAGECEARFGERVLAMLGTYFGFLRLSWARVCKQGSDVEFVPLIDEFVSMLFLAFVFDRHEQVRWMYRFYVSRAVKASIELDLLDTDVEGIMNLLFVKELDDSDRRLVASRGSAGRYQELIERAGRERMDDAWLGDFLARRQERAATVYATNADVVGSESFYLCIVAALLPVEIAAILKGIGNDVRTSSRTESPFLRYLETRPGLPAQDAAFLEELDEYLVALEERECVIAP